MECEQNSLVLPEIWGNILSFIERYNQQNVIKTFMKNTTMNHILCHEYVNHIITYVVYIEQELIDYMRYGLYCKVSIQYNIKSIPPNLNCHTLYISGDNTISSIPHNLNCHSLTIGGYNTISSIPPNLNYHRLIIRGKSIIENGKRINSL